MIAPDIQSDRDVYELHEALERSPLCTQTDDIRAGDPRPFDVFTDHERALAPRKGEQVLALGRVSTKALLFAGLQGLRLNSLIDLFRL